MLEVTSRVVGKVSMFDVRMPGIGQAQWKKQWDNQDGKSRVQYMFLFVSSIAKVIRRVQHWNLGQPQDITALLQTMGAQEQDRALLEFWGTSST